MAVPPARWNHGRCERVPDVMGEFLLDVLLPKTDRIVAIQWAVMTPFWLVMFWLTRRQPKDIRTFVYGLAMLNLAWFAARTVH